MVFNDSALKRFDQKRTVGKRMSSAKHTAIEIADWFLAHVDRQSGDTITHLKLQKLVYYAQAWHLANFNTPLFLEELQAWTHGPVAPSLWQKYKNHSWDALPKPTHQVKIDEQVGAFLRLVYDNYGRFEAKYLEELTHAERPWKETRGQLPLHERCTKPIEKTLMRDFYGEKINKKWPTLISAN